MISDVIRKAVAQFPVVVVTGARQAGKTSLVRHLFPDAQYVTFDIPQTAESARLDFGAFLRRHPDPLIIDEVQYVPEVLRHLKSGVDQDRRPGRFILTGSQDFMLMEGVTESLAGRCAVLSLPTLSLAEVDAGATTEKMDLFCWRGGFPELWQRPELDREMWLGSYLSTYLERDVRNILNIGSLRDFDRFLRAAALRVGQLLSLSELARDVGIAPNTAKSWIS
ncbi:MAG: ATP-binding protein, partial [Candidatus Omnitrophica bacterium]|nr:ATP-binding protein [Candidatus Omnitrophota bacterium]